MEPQIASTSAGPIEYAIEGTGVPVLVLHGSPGGIDQAELMARFLPRDRIRPVVVSRPGYLRTPLGDRLTIDQQADLLIALLDNLGIGRAGVLGWSGSGPTAYRLGVRHPDRISSIVVTDAVSKALTVPKPDLSTRLMLGTRAGEWLMGVLAAHQPKQVITGTLNSEGALTTEQLTERVEQVFADDTKRSFLLDLSATVNQSGARKIGYEHDCELLAAIESLELEQISCPCLIVQGSVDTDVTPDHATEAAARIPGAELMMLDTGTHMAFFTHPDAAKAQARAIEVFVGAMG